MLRFFCSIITYFAISLLIHNSLLHAQAPVGTDALWSELEEQIQKGNRRALRDLATFLDKPLYAEATRHTLQRYTFFTKNEINLTTATREEFLIFFYEHEQGLKFSEILKAFYLTPIESQVIDNQILVSNSAISKNENTPSVKLLNLSQKFDSLFLNKEEDSRLHSIVEQIADLQTDEAYDWLRRTLSSEILGQRYSDVYIALCEGLKTDPSQESLKVIVQAIDRGLVRVELLSSVFLELTNVAISLKQTQQLLDTLETLEALRAYGYDRSLSFREAFFYEKVDYYGKILSTPNTPHWIQRNALHDMLQTHHPRLLFFLAAQVRLKPDDKDKYVHLLQKLTTKTFDLPKNNAFEIENIETWKAYVRWWAVHWVNFEWDNTSGRFISREEMIARTEEVERLIRRLSSPNDSVAMGSFQQLTENDPSVVTTAMNKFRPLLHSYNVHLPELNYPFLENMTLLSAYCHTRKIDLKLPPSIITLWSKLKTTGSPLERYLIENQIIGQLTLKDITAFEYCGLLHSTYLNLNFSVSRILDIFYTKHWQEVVSDDNVLRHYMKKAALFERIGTGGTSSLYTNKLNRLDKNLCERLERIARTESDSNIRHGILAWLTPPTNLKDEGFHEVPSTDKKNENIENIIETLDSSPEILIDEINEFVSHPHFSEKYKPLLLKFLRKVTPLSSIRHFKLKNYLKASSDLSSFGNWVIPPKELDDFLSIFKIYDDAQAAQAEHQLWSFVNAQIARYSIDEVGSFWNTMFKITWFNNLIYDGAMMPSQRDTIILALRNYLNTSELLSEFEEQTTLTHLAELENIGRSLADKLAKVSQLDASNTIKSAVQMGILARIAYEDIGIVVGMYDQLIPSTDGESSLHFLQTDFGIPLFSDDKEAIRDLVVNHKKLSNKELYVFYLKKFGLNLWDTEGVLDYNKVYDILKHESVIPFTGGGVQRDYFTFGVIKLLEFNFGTRLGFHEKLNENQTFYTYNTSKRSAAWRQFLIDKKLVKIAPSVPPSFKS
ncbi:MAG: hypothetical protein JNL70_08865 [Saprospiraceae bacterium]|nr:hypothetical protein [Saprospiraceae bacterium]